MRIASILTALLLVTGCSKDKLTDSARPTDSGTSTARPSAHGSALPFEAGQAPKIEDLKVEDLSKFLVTHPWCTRAGGGSRYTFTQQGTWEQTSPTGAEEERGTWTLQNGWLVLAGADGGASRRIDIQTGKVNGRVVVSLDGRLYGACDEAAK